MNGHPRDHLDITRRMAAELLGAAMLTFVAAGGDALASLSGGQISVAARAVAPALLVTGLIYAIGDRSGAHFNPAVTVAFTLRRLFPVRLVIPYVAAQLAGAVLAAGALRWLVGDALLAGVTRPALVDPARAVAIEAILTVILLTVILGTADRAHIVGSNAAIAVGGAIALCGLIALPIEGASMNPARSTGPAVMAGDLASLWIYWVGPLSGAAIAVAIARLLHGPAVRNPDARAAATGSGAE
ncbi:MAG TPA: aquaporin [Candidatus Limnocylindrales bacterium]